MDNTSAFGLIIFLIVAFGFGGITVAVFVNDFLVNRAQKIKKSSA